MMVTPFKLRNNFMYTPYFYIIEYIPTNQYYAGVRYAAQADPDELLKEDGYNTSSTTVHSLIESTGRDSFKIRKIKIFTTSEEATHYEESFLKKVDAANNERFLNKTNNGLKYFKPEIVKAILLERYGVSSTMQIPGMIDKIKSDSMKKYGFYWPGQSDPAKQKRQETCLKRYGTTEAGASEYVMKKAAKTRIKKYGTSNMFESEHFKNKSKETCIEKYGVEFYSQSDDFKHKSSIAQKGRKHHRFNGWYITPNGKFGSSYEAAEHIPLVNRKFIARMCKSPNDKVSKNSYLQNTYLNTTFDSSIIGKTFKELGFDFEEV